MRLIFQLGILTWCCSVERTIPVISTMILPSFRKSGHRDRPAVVLLSPNCLPFSPKFFLLFASCCLRVSRQAVISKMSEKSWPLLKFALISVLMLLCVVSPWVTLVEGKSIAKGNFAQ